MTETSSDQPLSQRQELILRELVSAYIAAGDPVGSRTLVAGGVVSASPSTVRSELAELEHLGMLAHPHTSAGRVPTDAGYRYYAQLMLRTPLEPARLPVVLGPAHHEIEVALRMTAEALAGMTNLLAAISAPSLAAATVRHVELLALQPEVVMVVVITSSGGVSKRLFLFEAPVDAGLVSWAGSYLVETVVGLRLGGRQLLERLRDPALSRAELAFLGHIEPAFEAALDEDGLVVGGASGMLVRLRERDFEAMRSVVGALEQRSRLLSVLRDGGDPQRRVMVRVGSDLRDPGLYPFAMVSSGYGPGARVLGAVSLLGPMRMDYGEAIRSVRAAAVALSEFVEDVYE